MFARGYALLEGEAGGRGALFLRLGLQALILANVAAAALETVKPIGSRYAGTLAAAELVSLIVFTIEYVVRIGGCTADPRFQGVLAGRLRYAITPLAIVDLIAIAPMWLPLAAGLDMRSLRALRLLRILRILKLGRYSEGVRSLGRALREKVPELTVLSAALLLILVLASSVLYQAERHAQPSIFSSIPAAAWWGIATLTTVGYGDIAPVTPLGKLAGSVFAVLGIGLFALPAGLLSSAFVRQLSTHPARCPHCGKTI